MSVKLQTVIDGVKLALRAVNAPDADRSTDIGTSLALCLDDIADRLQSESFLSSATEVIAVNDREITLDDPDNDVRYLFALKFDNTVLEFVDPWRFLELYDSTEAVAGVITYYSILKASGGYPVIKFDRPASEAGTLTIYYWPDITQTNLDRTRSVSALVNGTIAYFYNGTPVGDMAYLRYEKGVARMRAGDSYRARGTKRIEPSLFEKDVKDIQYGIKTKRA